MSADNIEAGDVAVDTCASCGIAEVDDVKLKPYNGCDLVAYCSDACEKDHRPEHKEACKERSAELRDEMLFRQPESTHLGDCPICCLPLLDKQQSEFSPCCSKVICKGCSYANQNREWEMRLQPSCPFCRHPIPKSQEEAGKRSMKRVAVNEPAAIRKMGNAVYNKGDYDGAFKYWTRASELGDADAHYHLSLMYSEGGGVEKDEEKQLYHLEEAAIAGHPAARHYLGAYEGRNGRFERAVKHYIIAANLGYNESIQMLKEGYKAGVVSKEDFAAALRAHHAVVNATKSPQREIAAAWARENNE